MPLNLERLISFSTPSAPPIDQVRKHMPPKKQPIQQWAEGHVTWVCNEPHPRHHLFLKTDACSGRVYMKDPPPEFTPHTRIRFLLVGPNAKGHYYAENCSLAAHRGRNLGPPQPPVAQERVRHEHGVSQVQAQAQDPAAIIRRLRADVANKDKQSRANAARCAAFQRQVQVLQSQLAQAQSEVRELEEERGGYEEEDEEEVQSQWSEASADGSGSLVELLFSALFRPRQLVPEQQQQPSHVPGYLMGSRMGFGFFHMSPVLAQGASRAPVFQRFLRGLGAPSRNQDIFAALSWLNQQRGSGFEVVIGYHGTDGGAATKILQEGFDPAKRGQTGQQYGDGEYFDFDFQHSPNYASRYGTGAIVVTLIAVPAALASSVLTVNDTMIIVNNPTDGKTTFCLPMGLLTPEPVSLPHRSTGTPATGARVHYEDASRGAWVPFDAATNGKVLPWLRTATVGRSLQYTVGSQYYTATVISPLHAQQRNEDTGMVRRLCIR
jgi:hypothetical protein